MKFCYSLLLVVLTVKLRLTTGEVLFESVILDWEWPNDTVKNDYIKNGDYAPEACQSSGLKMGLNGEIFVTVPRLRYKSGVPAVLNTLILKGQGSLDGLLRPYPDWETNKVGNCAALQNPMSTALDPRTGYLYVIDIGRVGIMSPTDDWLNLCPAKIVVFDTKGGNTVVRSHEFPDSLVSQTGNFFNDLVLDLVDPHHPMDVKYAYISDTMGEQIVVFDFTTNTSWSFKHPSMGPDDDRNVTINGETYTFGLGINGIGMSPTFNYVYYSAIGSKKLWQIPTWVLRRSNGDFAGNVRFLGKKKSNSDALVFGHRSLYYGVLEDDALYRWEIQRDMAQQGVSEGEVTLQTETAVAQNWETMQWPDGIAFGNEKIDVKHLYFQTARAQQFHSGTMDFTGGKGANFRIFKIPIDETSYLVSEDDFSHAGSIIGCRGRAEEPPR